MVPQKYLEKLQMELAGQLLQAGDPYEAIRLKAQRLLVVRQGRILANAPERMTRLQLPGRPEAISLEFRPGSIS